MKLYAVVYNHDTFDDVVLPVETRERIARMLQHLPAVTRLAGRVEKKHPIDTW